MTMTMKLYFRRNHIVLLVKWGMPLNVYSTECFLCPIMYFRPYDVITSHTINLQTALVGASIPKILSEAYFRHEDCRCLGITEAGCESMA